MDFTKGGLLIVAGLFVLWIAVTGRTQKLFAAIGVLEDKPIDPNAPGPNPPNQKFTHQDTGAGTGSGYNVYTPSATGVVHPSELPAGALALMGGVPPDDKAATDSWFTDWAPFGLTVH